MNKWLSLYGTDKIDGFFIDESSNDIQRYSYYRDIYTFANSKGKLVILNPGANVDIKFFNISDKIVVFESNETDFEAFQYDNYSSINSDRVCSIVYGTSSDKVSFVKDKMLKNNSSCGYITDKTDNWQSGDSAYFI
jgi:Spherulation-specific family 4.